VTAVYVASPLGFDAAGRLYYAERVLPALVAAGLEALDPWAQGLAAASDEADDLRALNDRIGAGNVALLERAAGVLAVLDGVDVDSGTASEIGWASARGLPVVGVRTDLRMAGDNAAAVVNLQVQHFVERTGGAVVDDLDEAISLLATLVRGRSGELD
jgi:nucleoside 2-deoxyribosyltransferase